MHFYIQDSEITVSKKEKTYPITEKFKTKWKDMQSWTAARSNAIAQVNCEGQTAQQKIIKF